MDKKHSNSFLLRQVKELKKQINGEALDQIEFALAPRQNGVAWKTNKWRDDASWPKDERGHLLETLTFDPYNYASEEHKLLVLSYDMFENLGLISEFSIPKKTLKNFLRTLHHSYRIVPFHNFFHAFNVAQTMYYFLVTCKAKERFTLLEQLALLVSAFCHDVDHPGLNNAFLCATRTSLSAKYNDFSVLEQHHCNSAFQILGAESTNIFVNLTNEQYALIRKHIVSCILSTDLALHGDYMTKLKTRIENLNWENLDDKKLMMCCLVKCADISNEIRPTTIGQGWARRVMTEFFAQSSFEKAKGIPVSPHMDPEKTNTASGQIGFISYLCMPIFTEMVKVFPGMQTCVDQMIANREAWVAVESEHKQKQQELLQLKQARDGKVDRDGEKPKPKETPTDVPPPPPQQQQQQQQQQPAENKEKEKELVEQPVEAPAIGADTNQ